MVLSSISATSAIVIFLVLALVVGVGVVYRNWRKSHQPKSGTMRGGRTVDPGKKQQ